MRARSRAAALAGAPALALVVLTGCGSDRPDSSDGGNAADPVPTADAGDLPPGYSEERAVAFPDLVRRPDPDVADLRPDDWPEPVDDATLCRTSGTLGDAQQVDYATGESPVAVLDAFESALGALDGYEITREDPGGLGHEVVQGVAGEVGFQVDPTEGGFLGLPVAPGARGTWTPACPGIPRRFGTLVPSARDPGRASTGRQRADPPGGPGAGSPSRRRPSCSVSAPWCSSRSPRPRSALTSPWYDDRDFFSFYVLVGLSSGPASALVVERTRHPAGPLCSADLAVLRRGRRLPGLEPSWPRSGPARRGDHRTRLRLVGGARQLFLAACALRGCCALSDRAGRPARRRRRARPRAAVIAVAGATVQQPGVPATSALPRRHSALGDLLVGLAVPAR